MASLIGACTKPTAPQEAEYLLTLDAFYITLPIIRRTYCLAQIRFRASDPLPESVDAAATALVRRELIAPGGRAQVDSALSNIRIVLHRESSDSVRFELRGDLTGEFAGRKAPQVPRETFFGTWVCDHRFPLTDRVPLADWGYPLDLEMPGQWTISRSGAP